MLIGALSVKVPRLNSIIKTLIDFVERKESEYNQCQYFLRNCPYLSHINFVLKYGGPILALYSNPTVILKPTKKQNIL